MEKNFDAFFDKLKRVGVNTDKTIDRFGGLDELYVKFLGEFADTERFEEIYAALASGDRDVRAQAQRRSRQSRNGRAFFRIGACDEGHKIGKLRSG